jgi:hypothetical protein
MNLNSQGVKENRFEGGRTFEYGQAIDQKYGEGWAAFLNELSKKIEQWSIAELQQLRSAARMGYQVFRQLYFSLRPHHEFSPRKGHPRTQRTRPEHALPPQSF